MSELADFKTSLGTEGDKYQLKTDRTEHSLLQK